VDRTNSRVLKSITSRIVDFRDINSDRINNIINTTTFAAKAEASLIAGKELQEEFTFDKQD